MTIFIWGAVFWDTLVFWLPDIYILTGIWNTSDLDSMTIFIWGGYSGTPRIWTLWQFSFSVFWDTSDLDSLTNFIWGYSGTPWIWTLSQFSIGGEYSLTPCIWILWQFSFRGIFLDTLDLDSLTIFIGGSILGHLGFGLPDNFHFGGYSGMPRIWTLWKF